eukprot:8098188-Pyramimonas_sp.AAC.1
MRPTKDDYQPLTKDEVKRVEQRWNIPDEDHRLKRCNRGSHGVSSAASFSGQPASSSREGA